MQIAGVDPEVGTLLATPFDTPTIEHYNFFYGRRGAGVSHPAHDVLMKWTSGVGRGPWWWWPTSYKKAVHAECRLFLPSIQSDTMATDLDFFIEFSPVQSPGFVVTPLFSTIL